MSYLYNGYVTNLLINDKLFSFSFSMKHCLAFTCSTYPQVCFYMCHLSLWCVAPSLFPILFLSSMFSVQSLTSTVSFILDCWYLCFGFIIRIVLIAKQCFSYCWVVLTLSQGLFRFPCSANEQVHKKPGGSTARTSDSNWPKGYCIL